MISNSIKIQKHYQLNSNNCPVIPTGSEVILNLIHNFPSSNKQYITIQDAHRKTDRGEPIIGTILNNSNVLIEVNDD